MSGTLSSRLYTYMACKENTLPSDEMGASSPRFSAHSDCERVTSYLNTFYQLHSLFVAKIREWIT
jgi:hypothetical protein